MHAQFGIYQSLFGSLLDCCLTGLRQQNCPTSKKLRIDSKPSLLNTKCEMILKLLTTIRATIRECQTAQAAIWAAKRSLHCCLGLVNSSQAFTKLF
jgi:hypothetical protein